MKKSNYTIAYPKLILVIEDIGPHDQFLTVTNNIENVLEDIEKEHGKLPPLIIYKGSDDEWTLIQNENKVIFHPMFTTDKQEAIEMAFKKYGHLFKDLWQV